MSTEFPYIIILEPKYKPLELIEENLTADAAPRPWYNETLCNVNDSVVRLAVIEGEYHWHKHTREDEFFYVVEGCLHIDLIDPSGPATSQDNPRTITLNPRQGVVIPKDVLHRPRAPQRTVMLMVETDTIRPTGS
jgi:mannose-6-phosphate isomerase-like protein (cupin superfamily)